MESVKPSIRDVVLRLYLKPHWASSRRPPHSKYDSIWDLIAFTTNLEQISKKKSDEITYRMGGTDCSDETKKIVNKWGWTVSNAKVCNIEIQSTAKLLY